MKRTKKVSPERSGNPPATMTVKELADLLDTGLNQTAAYLVDPALNYKRRNCRIAEPTTSLPAGVCALPRSSSRPGGGATSAVISTSPLGVSTGASWVRSLKLRGIQPRCTSTVRSLPSRANGVST